MYSPKDYLTTTIAGGSVSSSESVSNRKDSSTSTLERNKVSMSAVNEKQNGRDSSFTDVCEKRNVVDKAAPPVKSVDDWGYFVDFHTPDVTVGRRKTFVSENRTSPLAE
jgi:hypothetical protein